MSVEEEHVYPPSRVFTQGLNFKRAAYPYSNCSTESSEAPEPLSARIRDSPTQEKLCQRIFKKLKRWFNRFLCYLSWKLRSSRLQVSSWTFYMPFTYRRFYPFFFVPCEYLCILSGYSSYQNKNVVGYLEEYEVMWTASTGALRGTGLVFINLTGRCRV